MRPVFLFDLLITLAGSVILGLGFLVLKLT